MLCCTNRLRRSVSAKSLGAVVLVVASGLAGCNNAGEGALSGAGVGALGGLAIGSLYGDAGKGALLGTAAGAIVGGVLGDQNRRNSDDYRRYR